MQRGNDADEKRKIRGLQGKTVCDREEKWVIIYTEREKMVKREEWVRQTQRERREME